MWVETTATRRSFPVTVIPLVMKRRLVEWLATLLSVTAKTTADLAMAARRRETVVAAIILAMMVKSARRRMGNCHAAAQTRV